MKVAKLIEFLSNFDKDEPVYLEDHESGYGRQLVITVYLEDIHYPNGRSRKVVISSESPHGPPVVRDQGIEL